MSAITEAETETTLLEAMRALPSESQRAVLSYALFLQHQEATKRESIAEMDETDYLLSSPANRERLLAAVTDIEEGRNLVVPDQTPFR